MLVENIHKMSKSPRMIGVIIIVKKLPRLIAK